MRKLLALLLMLALPVSAGTFSANGQAQSFEISERAAMAVLTIGGTGTVAITTGSTTAPTVAATCYELSANGTRYAALSTVVLAGATWQLACTVSGLRFLAITVTAFTSTITYDFSPSVTPFGFGPGANAAALGTVNAANSAAVGTGLEVHPARSVTAPTAVTVNRGQLLQVSDDYGALWVHLIGAFGGTPYAAAHDGDGSGVGLYVNSAVSKAVPTALSASNQTAQIQVDTATGGVYQEPVATTVATGFTPFVVAVNTTLNVKASAGNLYGYTCVNPSTAVCYLQFYNDAGAPTCGTNVVHSVPLTNTAATTSAISTSMMSSIPLANFAAGIGVCISTTQTGATTCAATASCTLWYK